MPFLLAETSQCMLLEEFPNAVDITLNSYTPFHLASLIIFACAIIHTLFANQFTKIAHKLEEFHEARTENDREESPKSFWAEIFHFLGEVEVVFGIWVIPLFILMIFFYNWDTAVNYIDTRVFIEPLFVVVIMCLTSTRPVVELAEGLLQRVSNVLGGSTVAWWLSILTIGPLLGSFITEAGAMTLSAIMLGHRFYDTNPSKKLAYGTLGLLFVNISVGGILTNFAAPPVLIISHCWNWSSYYMLTQFGWKAVLGILASNAFYYFVFRKELHALPRTDGRKQDKKPVPFWITLVHIVFIVWMVMFEHDTPVFIGSFLLFLGFHQATSYHQYELSLKRPILVGFFLAGLVIHGGLQGWWIIPLMNNLSTDQAMGVGAILTAFNDNAAVTYLSSLIPDLSLAMKEAIVSGVIVGGGLTVIANAPNPAGQMLLRRYFEYGISPINLFSAAFFPTLIMYAIFYFSL